MLKPTLLHLGMLVLLPAISAARPDRGDMQVEPRLEIKLWAAEPDVVDPVAICFDEEGRAYVAECRDYPYGVGPDGKVGSTIRLLVDSDGDGRADKSTVFAKDLSYATSVTPWRGGVLVTAAPDRVVLKDTAGDGVADVREVALTGFKRGVSVSLVNGLRYGLDGRIHMANGGNGGAVSSPKVAGTTTQLGDDDLALAPDTGEVGLTARSGGGFGLVFDDFGRAFTTYNINHLQHRFLPRHHAAKFPGFPPVEITGSISDHEEMSRIFPVSVAQTRPNHPEQAGHFSAAGGLGRLASSAFPEDLRGSLFVCDVVGNLVHRDVITPDGPVFRASRATNELDREFIASRDPAFRPVALETGPDGALYLLDMQRDVIEHPDYIPEKVKAKQDLRAGSDRGRIWRITPEGGLKAVRPSLGDAKVPDLVALLGHADPWWRLTAQRLLQERRAVDAVPALRRLARESPDPFARLHALWSLRSLGALTEADVQKALSDANAGVLENALRLAEDFLPDAEALHPPVIRLADDPSPRVRFQCALTLGQVRTAAAAGALVQILRSDASQHWTRLAVISSLRPADTRSVFDRLLPLDAYRHATQRGATEVLRGLSELAGARAGLVPDDVPWLILRLDDFLDTTPRVAILEGLVRGLQRSGVRPKLNPRPARHLDQLIAGAKGEELRALWQLARQCGLPENDRQRQALAEAGKIAADPALPLARRIDAVGLLGLGGPATAEGTLLGLLDGRQPGGIQAAALSALSASKAPVVGEGLVAGWRSYAPALRPQVLAILLDRRAFHPWLLAAVEAGRITVGELNLDLEQRRRLLRESDPAIHARASKFFGDEEYSNRKQVVTDWLARLPATGDAARGQKIFEEACARCHQSNRIGHKVGPDLSGVSHRSVEDLVSNILDPNMAINPGFVAYTVETQDGESLSGLLTGETSESVTLLQAMELRTTLPRAQISKLESSGQSLMPEGLEAGKTPQDLRDLVAFLQGAR